MSLQAIFEHARRVIELPRLSIRGGQIDAEVLIERQRGELRNDRLVIA